jgi:hypothetical protein
MTDATKRSGADSEREAHEVEDGLSKTIDQWKARIDEVKVQLDLAKLDVRDRATGQLEVAQNAYLAAASKLREARHDAAVNVDVLRSSIDKLLHDLEDAIEAAQAVISRG